MQGCGAQFVAPDPYISRVTHEIAFDCAAYIRNIEENLHKSAAVTDSWISLQGLAGARDSTSLRSRVESLEIDRMTLSTITDPHFRSYLSVFLTAMDLVGTLGRFDLQDTDGEAYPIPPPGPFGDIDPDSFTNRLLRSLYSGKNETDEANLEFRDRILTDARELSPEMRSVMEALVKTGVLPVGEVRMLTLAELATAVTHPAIAVVVMDELRRDPRSFEPVIAESDGRLGIADNRRRRTDPPGFTDLTENIAYHAARYLRRVEARGDGHAFLTAVRRPLEPIALRVIPDRSAADDALLRLANARDALPDSAPGDATPVDGLVPAIAARARACAGAVLTLAAMDLAVGNHRSGGGRRPSR